MYKTHYKIYSLFFLYKRIGIPGKVEKTKEKGEKKQIVNTNVHFYHQTTLYFLPTTSQSSPSSTVN